jgi:glycerol-3-phosphate dehydrogenase subunit C
MLHTIKYQRTQMSIREGSLEAPTRHPLDWQNPKFYDKADLEAEMERVFPGTI